MAKYETPRFLINELEKTLKGKSRTDAIKVAKSLPSLKVSSDGKIVDFPVFFETNSKSAKRSNSKRKK